MRISRIELENWRNFKRVNVPLASRVFIIGNNGTGKSNLLDALRFLRDIAKRGGGLYNAIESRGGMAFIRSLFAGSNPSVQIAVEVENGSEKNAVSWRYELKIKQENFGNRRPIVAEEVVKKNGEKIFHRATDNKEKDPDILTQTALEQIAANKEFRDLAKFFGGFRYLHMVPQLVRHGPDFQGKLLPDDPFGQGLFEHMAGLETRVRNPRLRRLTGIVQQIKPNFGDFEFKRDEKTGDAHLVYRHKHWRKSGARQNEQQLSDGELRLIGLAWTLFAADPVTMLEEPEISFNEGIVRELPSIFAKTIADRQIILTTHSHVLLTDKGISPHEVILLRQKDGQETEANTLESLAKKDLQLDKELNAGLSVAEAALHLAQTSIGEARKLTYAL